MSPPERDKPSPPSPGGEDDIIELTEVVADASTEAIELTEGRLSERAFSVLVRSSLRKAAEQLRNGDLVGVVTTEPGRLISHTGLVTRNAQGVPRLLHASSHHGRVVVTSAGLPRYVLRRPNRWGIIVARPLAPDR